MNSSSESWITQALARLDLEELARVALVSWLDCLAGDVRRAFVELGNGARVADLEGVCLAGARSSLMGVTFAELVSPTICTSRSVLLTASITVLVSSMTVVSV